ncbi:MAG TPA: prolyl oligopeptidase family serine peptidase, partial [Pyrinomonadaceae bacterium]|nr:prolyl oligopeptidase family serine peptidase [Pyrinomonadaceae bacterium]
VDARASTAISHTLETMTRGELIGEAQLKDLLDAVKWVKSQSFVDPERIGIWGWSGGGTFTLLAMTHSAEFKAGIAVAAVTDWTYYDTKATESGMKLPALNPEGYDDSSLVKSAKNLHGRLLLVHGTYDDNVHIQNAWSFTDELIKAGKMFDMMIYPMRQHGIADRAARIHLYKTMVEFWKRNL